MIGVGALLLMFMIFDSLVENRISVVEADILFLSHGLWTGGGLLFYPPFALCFNPHLYLTIGVWMFGTHLAHWQCLVLSSSIIFYSMLRRQIVGFWGCEPLVDELWLQPAALKAPEGKSKAAPSETTALLEKGPGDKEGSGVAKRA